MNAKRGQLKKQADIENRRFWLVVACALVIGVWLCLYILSYQVFSAALNQVASTTDPASYTYDVLHIIGTPLTLVVSAVITIPLAYVVFKKLRLHRPLIDAMGLLLSLVFALSAFTLLFDALPGVYDLPGYLILAILAGTVFVSVLAYGLILRFAVKRLPATVALIAMVLLPLAVILIHIIYRISLTPLL